MEREVAGIIQDIKSLKIQGARNIAKAAVQAIIISAQKSKAQSAMAFNKDLAHISEALSTSRPTEPMMRNVMEDAVRFASAQMKKAGKTKKTSTTQQLKKALVAHETAMIKHMDDDAKKLAEYGAQLIPDDAFVLTYCHSSTVTGILKAARSNGKKFSVGCFETRPRFQGRITAEELARAGIDVTLTVDGGMNLLMKKADIVLVGADAVTSRGDLINKIGTSTLAHIARMNDVSFYSAAELFKYSPMTMFGTREEIEERDPREVWETPPKGVGARIKIRNPAFEATAAKYISGYITEVGVIPTQSIFAVATEKLGIKLYE